MSTPTNKLLRALSPEVRGRILAASKHVSLPVRTVLQSPDERPKYCYFLTSGATSSVIYLVEGGSAEVTLIGAEAFADVHSVLGPAISPTSIFMQIAGDGYRIGVSDLRAIFLDSEEFRTLTLQLVQQQSLTVSQLAACNKLHGAEARLARWILMADDRVNLDPIPITQEFLAQMLGTRRTTVALAAGTLQSSGFIQYSRGKIRILSRERLQEVACECYPIVARLFQNLYVQDAWDGVQERPQGSSRPERLGASEPKTAINGSGQGDRPAARSPEADQDCGD